MSKKCRQAAVVLLLSGAFGCNRQDADALSKIGQMVVQRAKTMPIVTPHAKPGANPVGAQAPENLPDQNK